MSLRQSLHAPLLCLCFLICSVTATAQLPGQENALGSMRGVKVLIFTSNDELKGADLSRDVLSIDVELRLRKFGVPVLQGKEWPTNYQKAVLVVRVLLVKQDDEVAATIIVQLWRVVEGDGPLYVSTWENIGVGLFSESVVRTSLRERIGDHVDKFANDYLAANPKLQR